MAMLDRVEQWGRVSGAERTAWTQLLRVDEMFRNGTIASSFSSLNPSTGLPPKRNRP